MFSAKIRGKNFQIKEISNSGWIDKKYMDFGVAMWEGISVSVINWYFCK